jgi:hypothetical protein
MGVASPRPVLARGARSARSAPSKSLAKLAQEGAPKAVARPVALFPKTSAKHVR